MVDEQSKGTNISVGIVEFISFMVATFGLRDWDIGLNVADCPGGNATWGASVDTDSEYLEAIIEIKPGMTLDHDTARLLVHELMHIALAEYRAVWIRALNFLDGDKALKDFVLQSAEYAENRAAQQISRGIVKLYEQHE